MKSMCWHHMRGVIKGLPRARYEKLVEEQRRHAQRIYPPLPEDTIEEIATLRAANTTAKSRYAAVFSR